MSLFDKEFQEKFKNGTRSIRDIKEDMYGQEMYVEGYKKGNKEHKIKLERLQERVKYLEIKVSDLECKLDKHDD